jgi:hypothetical protein
VGIHNSFNWFSKTLLSLPQIPSSIKFLIWSSLKSAFFNISVFLFKSQNEYFQFTSGIQTLCASSIASFCASVKGPKSSSQS